MAGVGLIDHKSGRPPEVFTHGSAGWFLNARRLYRFEHVAQPQIALMWADYKGSVAHPQPRMAALFAISAGATKILHQEQVLSLFACF